MKATLIERFNRSLLSRLWKYLTYRGGSRYIDVLNDIVSAYNNRVHRSTGLAPAKVKATDAFKIWQRLHGDLNDVKPPKIKVGDFVCLSKLRKQFQKVTDNSGRLKNLLWFVFLQQLQPLLNYKTWQGRIFKVRLMNLSCKEWPMNTMECITLTNS